MSHVEMRSLIDAHFAGRIAPGNERSLREHLPGCEACRAYYDRHLLLARLDPAALPADDRLGRGLGLGRRRPGRWLWSTAAAAAGAAAVAALLLVVMPRQPGEGHGFQARGTAAPEAAEGSELVVYRVSRAEGASRVSGAIAATDELAFAYRNPRGFRYLMVFGVDEHRHVYWFHPAWSRAEENPTAVPIRRSADLVELPEAVGHRLDGSVLRIHALLVDRPLSVRAVEARLATGARARITDGGDQLVQTLEVKR